MNYSVLPPEINSLRMFTGAGSAPMLAAPDVWTAFAGSLPTATAVLGRWPDIRLLAGAPTRNWRRSTTG